MLRPHGSNVQQDTHLFQAAPGTCSYGAHHQRQLPGTGARATRHLCRVPGGSKGKCIATIVLIQCIALDAQKVEVEVIPSSSGIACRQQSLRRQGTKHWSAHPGHQRLGGICCPACRPTIQQHRVPPVLQLATSLPLARRTPWLTDQPSKGSSPFPACADVSSLSLCLRLHADA